MKLVCPSCGHSAPIDAFILPRIGDWFSPRAFGLLLVIVTFALLRGCGLLK